MQNILASTAEEHTKLCQMRYDAKKKTGQIDRQFMEISNRITNEISALNKSKISSAILK